MMTTHLIFGGRGDGPMSEITIENPHGYLRDDEGRVVIRFGNWETGEHQVPDVVSSVDYVDGPADHDEQVADRYKPD